MTSARGGTVVTTRKRSSEQPVYTDLAITIDSFTIRIDAGVNYELHDLRHAGSEPRFTAIAAISSLSVDAITQGTLIGP
jgi:hypothetical protein